MRPYLENTHHKKGWWSGSSEVVKHLFSKYEALNSNTNTAKKKKKKNHWKDKLYSLKYST
jgi:hypothetical protein